MTKKQRVDREALLLDARNLRESLHGSGHEWAASVVADLVKEIRRETRAAERRKGA